ncbi:MAG: hypothetical protein JSS46_09935 [Proteobacteria bacterium]|nr:hypothetical protein [Pseudomonadota bacterium]
MLDVKETTMLKSTTIVAGIALSLAAATASAATRWENAHPRRDEINDRLATQSHRISGQIGH